MDDETYFHDEAELTSKDATKLLAGHNSRLIIPLNSDNLDQIALLRAGEVAVPAYDRSEVEIGIVHFGAGYFARSHFARYIDEIMATGDLKWGIATIDLRSEHNKKILDAQNGLYTLVERNGEVHARVIGSIMESHAISQGEDAYQNAIARMVNPKTRLITMTISEAGYKEKDGQTAQVVKMIVEALQHRRSEGLPTPTIMSCDNIPNNGKLLEKAVLLYAEKTDPKLREWIEQNVSFPSTMVDRITPSLDVDKRRNPEVVGNSYAIQDRGAVVSETHRSLVIEDNFSNPGDLPEGLKDLEGVTITPNPEPYELTKIRTLNGAHVAVGIIGHLTGYELARDAMRNPQIKEFVRNFIDDSLASLGNDVVVNEDAYGRDITVSRIANEHLEDGLTRLPRNCSDGKMKNRVLASAIDLLSMDIEPHHHAFVTAAWMQYLKGFDAKGQFFDISDPNAQKQGGLQEQLRSDTFDADQFFENTAIFDVNLKNNGFFTEAVKGYYRDINTLGMKAALAKFNEEHRDSTLEAKPDISAGKPEFRM